MSKNNQDLRPYQSENPNGTHYFMEPVGEFLDPDTGDFYILRASEWDNDVFKNCIGTFYTIYESVKWGPSMAIADYETEHAALEALSKLQPE